MIRLVLLMLMVSALPLLGAWPATLLSIYALAFIPYFALLPTRGSHSAIPWKWLLGAALLVRIWLVFWPPILSDDLFRYVWEGRVFVAGLNPFVLAPNADELIFLRDSEIWPSINHSHIPTIYPPVAQFVFGFNALIDGGGTSLRLIFVALELILTGLIVRELPALRRYQFCLIYLLNPLVIIELAWSGHLDAIAYLSALWGLLLWLNRRSVVLVGLILGLSISTKFLGIMALALVVLTPGRSLGPKAWVALVSVITVGATYLPFAEAGPDLLAGFGTYAASWRSNDIFFRAIYSLSETVLTLPDGQKVVFDLPQGSLASDQISATLGKAFAVCAMSCAFVWSVTVIRRPVQGFLLLMGTLLLFAPTVHPWYVAWLVPFAAAAEKPEDTPMARAALIWSASVILAYLAWLSYGNGGAWHTPSWVAWVQGGLVLFVLATTRPKPHLNSWMPEAEKFPK